VTTDDATRRRLDHDLYAAGGVAVLGAAVFIVGFAIEKNSHTAGRAVEVVGFVLFGVGLLVSAAVGYHLSRHFASTIVQPGDHVAPTPGIAQTPLEGYVQSTRIHQGLKDPAVEFEREVDVNPEDDTAKGRFIEQERLGANNETDYPKD
jgi:hypothetical protein